VGVLLAFDLGDGVLIGVTAMRTIRTIGPANSLKGFAGLILVRKHGVPKSGFGHRFAPMPLFYGDQATFFKYIVLPWRGTESTQKV
jgi:hypothetical protein